MDKSLEKQMVKQRKFFEDILSGMEDWVRVIDVNSNVLFMNEPMKKHLGDNVGKRCFQSLGKTTPCTYCISNSTIFEGKTIIKEEIVDGKVYSVLSSPIRDESNNIYCAVEVFRDITEAKAIEALVLEQNRKMKNDLNFAKQLQHKILPENKIYNDALNIASMYIPSEILGGDVYDVIEIDKEHMGLYIADVSGHGVTSSMMTMFIRQTLKNLGKDAINPATTLRYLQGRYAELNIDDEYYITIFYGVYNKATKVFTYSNAGHNCMPIVIGKDKMFEIQMEGLPICTLFEDIEYDNERIIFEKGDKILFYTDGIIEARNEQEGFFRSHRMLSLCQEHRDKDIDQLVNMITHYVRAFSTWAIRDDMAIMAAEIL